LFETSLAVCGDAQDILRERQQWLLGLHHARSCNIAAPSNCAAGYCGRYKELLRHAGTCTSVACSLPQCRTFRPLLQHSERCSRDAACPLCEPLREVMRQEETAALRCDAATTMGGNGGGGGGDDDAAPIVALGGPMYDEATARKMLKEVVLFGDDEDEPTGFNPDDAALDNTYQVSDIFFCRDYITPMIYFASKGDVQMCRYLISRGASTTKWSVGDWTWSPMGMAAHCGHLEFCKVLHANGGKNDIWKDDYGGCTPIEYAASNFHDELVRWFVLQGALCSDANSEEVEGDRFLGVTNSQVRRLVNWAAEVTSSHSSMVMFLLGTLPPAPDADQSCILQCLGGHPGLRKHVTEFVGLEVTKGKHLRILRQVAKVAFVGEF